MAMKLPSCCPGCGKIIDFIADDVYEKSDNRSEIMASYIVIYPCKCKFKELYWCGYLRGKLLYENSPK